MNRNALSKKVSLVLEADPKEVWYDFQLTKDLKKVINNTLDDGKALLDIVYDVKSLSVSRIIQVIGRKMKEGAQATFDSNFAVIVKDLKKDVSDSDRPVGFVGFGSIRSPQQLSTWLYEKLKSDPVSCLFIVGSILKSLSEIDGDDDFMEEARMYGRNVVLEHGDLADKTLLGDYHNRVIERIFSVSRDGKNTANPAIDNVRLINELVNALGYRNLISLRAVCIMDQDDFDIAIKEVR